MRIPYITLAAFGALALSGCAYDNMGYGYGGPYGYGAPYVGASVGYNPYYGYGYGPYGYGDPYFGWYDDFYYPGTGIYVYDSYRRPHMWNDRQRNYWTSRQRSYATSGTQNTQLRSNWSGFRSRTRSPR